MDAFIIFAILAVVAFIIFAFDFMYRLRTYEKSLEQETPKVYPYKYQTPFDDKLIELGVKEKWDSNWENQGRAGDCAEHYAEGSFEYFIGVSFDWDKTEDGTSFWYKISKK